MAYVGRASALGGLMLAAALALQACSSSSGTSAPPPREASVNVQDRPSMEHMLTHYRKFRKDLFDALAKDFGHRGWTVPPADLGEVRSHCGNSDADGETVGLPNMAFAGSYPSGRTAAVQHVVESVGKRYGFTHVTVLSDHPGNLDIVGHDEYGGKYEFGEGNHTVLGISTGCHRWDTPPSADS